MTVTRNDHNNSNDDESNGNKIWLWHDYDYDMHTNAKVVTSKRMKGILWHDDDDDDDDDVMRCKERRDKRSEVGAASTKL